MLSRTENNISLVIGSWTLRRLTHSDCWSHSDPNDRQPNHRCHRLHRLYRKGPLPDPIGSWPPSSPPEPVGFRAKFWPATVVPPAADYPDIFTVARSTDPDPFPALWCHQLLGPPSSLVSLLSGLILASFGHGSRRRWACMSLNYIFWWYIIFSGLLIMFCIFWLLSDIRLHLPI